MKFERLRLVAPRCFGPGFNLGFCFFRSWTFDAPGIGRFRSVEFALGPFAEVVFITYWGRESEWQRCREKSCERRMHVHTSYAEAHRVELLLSGRCRDSGAFSLLIEKRCCASTTTTATGATATTIDKTVSTTTEAV